MLCSLCGCFDGAPCCFGGSAADIFRLRRMQARGDNTNVFGLATSLAPLGQ